jgi:hypothetical protein
MVLSGSLLREERCSVPFNSKARTKVYDLNVQDPCRQKRDEAQPKGKQHNAPYGITIHLHLACTPDYEGNGGVAMNWLARTGNTTKPDYS